MQDDQMFARTHSSSQANASWARGPKAFNLSKSNVADGDVRMAKISLGMRPPGLRPCRHRGICARGACVPSEPLAKQRRTSCRALCQGAVVNDLHVGRSSVECLEVSKGFAAGMLMLATPLRSGGEERSPLVTAEAGKGEPYASEPPAPPSAFSLHAANPCVACAGGEEEFEIQLGPVKTGIFTAGDPSCWAAVDSRNAAAQCSTVRIRLLRSTTSATASSYLLRARPRPPQECPTVAPVAPHVPQTRRPLRATGRP